MDPIGMASSALQIIAAYKKKIDEAKLVYEDAKQLLRSLATSTWNFHQIYENLYVQGLLIYLKLLYP